MDKHGPPHGMQPPPPGFVPPPPYTNVPHQEIPPMHSAAAPVIIMHSATFGSESQAMSCPHCHASISTRVENETTSKTHLFFLLLCLLGCFPCAPCVYCMDSCLAKKHYCPACNAFLGQYDN